jgi:prepilin signal peptidase PulO-like enzyme (type II secretory pathway)
MILIPGIGSFLFLFLLFVGTKGRGMGFGDVVFAGYMGLLLGFPYVAVAHYIAFLTGAFISSILILLKRKHLKGSTIPFGPFLVLGTYTSFLWGEKILELIKRLL